MPRNLLLLKAHCPQRDPQQPLCHKPYSRQLFDGQESFNPSFIETWTFSRGQYTWKHCLLVCSKEPMQR